MLAREHLGLEARDYGLMLGAIGIGAAAGPLLLTKLTDNPRQPGYVFGPFVLRAAVYAVLATFTGLAPALVALIAYGVGTSTGAVTFNSLLQAETADRTRGRIFAGFDLLWQTGRLLSLPSSVGPASDTPRRYPADPRQRARGTKDRRVVRRSPDRDRHRGGRTARRA